MPSQSVDAIVLGAGIVGVSAALALQARGRTVAIVDRLGEAAGETSFGNTGIVQSEAVFPYLFPRAPAEIALAALNRDPRAHIRYGALPSIAPGAVALFPRLDAKRERTRPRRRWRAFVGGAAAEHRKLAEAAGAGALLRATGWIKVFRTRARRGFGARGDRGAEALRRRADAARPGGARPRSSRMSGRPRSAARISPSR